MNNIIHCPLLSKNWQGRNLIWRTMKVTFVLLFSVLMHVSAAGLAQKINLNKKNTALTQVFTDLGKQSGYQFFYNERLLEKASKVDITILNGTLDEALKLCFKNQPFSYEIVDKTVVVKEKEKSILDKIADYLAIIEVKGRVTDKDGQPVPGVIIKENGKTTSVTTDANGEYRLKVDENATLKFSYVGYKTEEIAVNGKNQINLSLKEDVNSLKEVGITTGYQTINKKLFTGSSVTLKGTDIKQDGITDVSRMLEGRVAGVSVQNVSGTFGAAPKIRVRGATSITGDNKPLWVVDGVVLEDVVNISNEQLSSGDVNTLIGSSVAGLNADDIESFTILKDAAATAQYGARAMNGVVVITTKKGHIGKTKVSYTGNFSTSLKPSYSNYNILNSADQMSVYSELERKGWLNLGKTSRNADGGVFTKMYQEINTYDASSGKFGLENTPAAKNAFLQRYAMANTDWFDLLFKNSLQQEHSLSISTGTEKSQLYFSTSYLNDNGWAMGNKVDRFTTNMNANFNLSDKLTINFITTSSIREQKAPGTVGRVSNPVEGKYSRDFDINPFSYSLNTSRTMTALDQNGNREYFPRNFAPFNILSELENNTLDVNLLDFKLQGGLNYKINPHLKYDFMASMRYVKSGNEHKVREDSNMANAYRAAGDSYIQENNRFLYRDPEHPELQPVVVLPYGGFYDTQDDYLKAYMVRNSLEYNNTFNENHLINVYVAQETRIANRQSRSNIGYGYQYSKGGEPFIDPDILKQAILGNSNYYSMGHIYDRFAAFMGRAAYSYKGKYSLNATARYDGSNQLGKSANARWLPTWNVSGAWNVDTEDFMQKQSLISRLTLRATYGLTASLGSATNSALVLKNASAIRPYINDKESVMNINYIQNDELTWEKQYETNIGVDVGLFKDRLNLTVDVYKRNGFDLISPIRTSGIGGQYLTTANYANMQTKGLEVSLSGKIIDQKDWKWRSNFNFAINTNKVTNLKSPQNIFSLVTADGGPQQGFPYRGLYSIDFQGLNHDTGIPTFIDQDGKLSNDVYLQSDVTKYLKYEGPTDPKLMGGFMNTVSYKGFTLNTLFTFSAGNKIRLNPFFATSYSDLDALPTEFKDRWILPGDEAFTNVPSIPDVSQASSISGKYPYNAYNYSSARVADGGFIRLKQVSLSYSFKDRIAKIIGANNASLSLVANNFWLIYSDKKLRGQDPEFFASGGVALPIPKQYTVSLKVGF